MFRRRVLAALIAISVAGCASPASPAGPIGSSGAITSGNPSTTAVSGANARPSPTAGALNEQPGGGAVTVVAAGDIACDPSSNTNAPARCDQDGTAALIGELRPSAVLPLGDEAYQDGTLQAFNTTFDSSWGRYRSILRPAPGNHEYLTPDAAGYFTYFHSIAPYYSFDLGAWHLVSLNSECRFVGGCQSGSAQETWLRADLAAHAGQCSLVYWHEPRWSSGEHGDATQMTTIWNDLVAARVTVALAGHNHDYERFVPLDAGGSPDPTGVTEFVVGTGGKNHYQFTKAPLTGEVVRDDTSFGVLDLTLSPGTFSWRYVSAAGYSFADSGSASCR